MIDADADSPEKLADRMKDLGQREPQLGRSAV